MRHRRYSVDQEVNHQPRTTSWLLSCTAVAASLCFAAASTVSAQVASALIREADPLPAAGAGQVVSSLGNTAVNHVSGYAVGVNSSDGGDTISHIWGNAAGGAGAILRTEGTIGPFIQLSFESFYGMSNAGELAYSASGDQAPSTGLDSVWVDDTPVAVEEQPVTALPGQYWSFASRPSISGDGVPHWIGGITNIQGGSTQNRVMATTLGGTIVLKGGDTPTGLPAPISTASGLSFDYRYSGLSSHYIVEVTMDLANSAIDNAVVVDGAGLMLGGSLVQEGTPIPVSIGGLAGENWDNFDFMGYTEAGEWFFTGDSDGATTSDEIIVKNGQVFLREGDVLDGETLSGSIEGAYMNEDGDLAFIWDVQSNTLEALYVNDQLLLKEGDEVDWTGDGVVDSGYTVAGFTGISALTIGDRDGSSNVDVYFTADIMTPTGGTLEGCFRMTVENVPVELMEFTVE